MLRLLQRGESCVEQKSTRTIRSIMARREITQYFDDLDNSPLTEGRVECCSFQC